MNFKLNRQVSAYICFLLGIISLAAAVIRDIRVEASGIYFDDPDLVFSIIEVQKGDAVDQRRISRDVKNLLATEMFSFVSTELRPAGEDFDLIYHLTLKPRLAEPVVIIGAEAAGANKVREWLELETGAAVDDIILNLNSRKVRQEYHKRYYPDVKLSWDISTDSDTGFAKVLYRVQEGERAKLRKVSFQGNTYRSPALKERFLAGLKNRDSISEKSVPPRDLKTVLKPRLWHVFSFFTKRGAYDPDELEADCDTLRDLYFNRGYLDADITLSDVNQYRRGKLEANFLITEGEQYRLGNIAFKGYANFTEAELRALVSLRSDDIASLGAIYNTASNLRSYYWNRGYMRAQVEPVIKPHLTEAVVDLEFHVTEGEIVNIRYIDIKGNSVTKDKVIRRELTVYPGGLYDLNKVRQSEYMLRNLGFLSDVSSYPRETSYPDQDDLVFDVKEGSPGNFGLGLGYSSVDEVLVYAEIAHGNFDLFNWPYFTGGGQKLRLRAQGGNKTQDYLISLTEPWFLNRRLSLGGEAYRSVRQNLSKYYDESRTGGALTLGKPIPFFLRRAELRYSLDEIDIYSVSDDAIERIKQEEGKRLASSLKLTLSRDTRDRFFETTKGMRTTLSGRLTGGPLGGDVEMFGLDAEFSLYHPLWFGHIFNLRGYLATVQEYGSDDDVRIFDRLFLGGPRMMRGFKYRHVSPHEEDEPIGGKTLAFAIAEYTVPITPKIFRLAFFYEIGNVWLDSFDMDTDYCSDFGIGLRFNIPALPLRVDYAWPMDVSGDVEKTSGRFNVWFGYDF